MVTAEGPARRLLDIYIDIVRPKLLQLRRRVGGNGSPAFLNYNGETAVKVGRKLTQFCLAHTGLHITTTTVRSLVETESDDRIRSGQLDMQTRAAIMNLGGHSSSTTKHHYVHRQREAEVELVNRSWLQTDDANVEVYLGPNGNHDTDWGIDHPQHRKKNLRRVIWSAAEQEWLIRWKQSNPNLFASQCLVAICETAAARRIFHPHHVTNALRLDYGLDKIRSGEW